MVRVSAVAESLALKSDAMKLEDSAPLRGSDALDLYVSRLTAALTELTKQARLLRDEANQLADAVARDSAAGASESAQFRGARRIPIASEVSG